MHVIPIFFVPLHQKPKGSPRVKTKSYVLWLQRK